MIHFDAFDFRVSRWRSDVSFDTQIARIPDVILFASTEYLYVHWSTNISRK